MARFMACTAMLLVCLAQLSGAAADETKLCRDFTKCSTCLTSCLGRSSWGCNMNCMWCDSSSSCVTRPSDVSTTSGSYTFPTSSSSNAGETCYTKYEVSGAKQCGFDPDPVAVVLCTVCPLIGFVMAASVWGVIKCKLRRISRNRPAINAALEAELKQDLASSNETADWQGFGYPEKYASLCGLWFLLVPLVMQVGPSLVWWIAVGLPEVAGFALYMTVLMFFLIGTLFMCFCLCGVCVGMGNSAVFGLAEIYALTATKAIAISVDPSSRRRTAAKYYPYIAMNTLQVKGHNLWFQRTITFVNTRKGMRQRVQMAGFRNIEDTSTPFSLLQPKVNTAAVNMTPMNAMFGHTRAQPAAATTTGGGAAIAPQPTQTNAALQAQLLAQQQQIAQLMAMQQAQMAAGGTAVLVGQSLGSPTTQLAYPPHGQPGTSTSTEGNDDGKDAMLL